jgi:hypothetical protein
MLAPHPHNRRNIVTISTQIMLAAALAGAAAPRARAAETPAMPATAQGQGGPYEPVTPEPGPILVEGRPQEARTIAPDPRLARRYAPRPRGPVNRITVRF